MKKPKKNWDAFLVVSMYPPSSLNKKRSGSLRDIVSDPRKAKRLAKLHARAYGTPVVVYRTSRVYRCRVPKDVREFMAWRPNTFSGDKS